MGAPGRDHEVTFRRATPADEPALRDLLVSAGLPADDVDVARQAFVLAFVGDRLVGSVAVEAAGADGLVRSLAVVPEHRRRGIGRALHERALALAARRGVRTLYLLTTTAAEYAVRHGFERVDRGEVPAAIAAHAQFRSLCPASAACLRRRLPAVPDRGA
jgi:amino-acid N-acetyltransferase